MRGETNAHEKKSKMLVDGPVEWAETSIPTGNKLDLLQHAYHPRLGVAAFPKDATVVLVQYASVGDALATNDEVTETAKDEIVLHPAPERSEKEAKAEAFRFVAWSTSGSEPHAYVAIATVERVEVWRVSCSESLQAVLVGSIRKSRIRGVCWHPVTDTLLIFNDTDLSLIQVVSDDHLRVHPLELPSEGNRLDKTKHCAWSPCGLVLARSSERCIYFYSWPNAVEIWTFAPSASAYRIDAPSSITLLGNEATLGSVTAAVLLSPSVCVVVTDTPLVLADIKSTTPSPETVTPAWSSLASTTPTTASSNVIDLTSLRITATSKSSLLNILDHSKPATHQPATPVTKRTSHLTVVAKNHLGEWHRYAEVALDQLAIPDVVDAEAMRVAVGSTISNRIVAIHLDHSLKSGWAASVSGEIELPEGHVCRGLRLAKTSPFVQIASTEKPKRTFFHAASGPQRIQLSKFKVPRRRRVTDHKPSIDIPVAATTETLRADASSPDLMVTLLTRIEALQTLVVARFDDVEQRLDDVVGRLARLEAQTTTAQSL